jgi:hypothetical protein
MSGSHVQFPDAATDNAATYPPFIAEKNKIAEMFRRWSGFCLNA